MLGDVVGVDDLAGGGDGSAGQRQVQAAPVAEQDGLAEVLVAAAARLGGGQLPEGSAGLGGAFGHASVSLARPASPWPCQRCSVPVLSVVLAVPVAKVALPWPKSAADTRPVRPLRQQ